MGNGRAKSTPNFLAQMNVLGVIMEEFVVSTRVNVFVPRGSMGTSVRSGVRPGVRGELSVTNDAIMIIHLTFALVRRCFVCLIHSVVSVDLVGGD